MDQTNVRDSVKCGNAHLFTGQTWAKPWSLDKGSVG